MPCLCTKLRMARLGRTRRQANQIFYRIDNDHFGQLLEDAIRHAEHIDESQSTTAAARTWASHGSHEVAPP